MSILIGTPMYGGQCTAAYFESCLQAKEDLTTTGVKHDWLILTNESLITRARNTIAATFLQTDFEALLFIDADIRFHTEDVAKLWNMDVPVAVGAYRLKKEKIEYSCWNSDGILSDLWPEEELIQVEYAATGFMMIRREVFEEMKEVVQIYYEDGKKHAFFQTPVEDSTLLSEDYFFCRRWRELGGKILLDPSINLSHIGSREYAS